MKEDADINSLLPMSVLVCHRFVDVDFSSCDVCAVGCDAQADVNSSLDVCFRCFSGSDAHAASNVSTSGNDDTAPIAFGLLHLDFVVWGMLLEICPG